MNKEEKELKNKKDISKKSNKKKMLTGMSLVMLVIVFVMAGSYVYKEFFLKETTMDKKATKKYKYLIAREWVSKDKSKTITFTYDGKVSYVDSDSGKAIEGFDKYNKYVYHNSKKLSVYGKKGRRNIDILKIGRNNLKISYNGKSVSFTNSLLEEGQAKIVDPAPSNTWYMCSRCDFVIMDYVLYGYTSKLTKDSINCYELYDSSKPDCGVESIGTDDPGKKEGYLEHTIAKDARFYTINSSSEILEDDTLIDHNCTLNKITINEAMKLCDKGKKDQEVYMFANEDMEIDKVIFYSLDLKKSDKTNLTEKEVGKLTDKIQKQNAAFDEQLVMVIDDVSVNDIDRFIDNDKTK